MRRILLVFLKDTFYSGVAGAAQWHYSAADSDQLRVKLLQSGTLIVYRLDPENGVPQAHLDGERGVQVAVFPQGGWAGYAWEEIGEAVAARVGAAASGLVVAH